jgi:hypothetical protein
MTQPRNPVPQAVQYWYDAAIERREERDQLRAVVSRVRQMADAWEQQLPEVIRTPAVVSAIRAALEPAAVSPPADRAAAPTVWIDGHPQLEAIARAVWEQCGTDECAVVTIDDPRNIAVAALGAVLPAPDQRAAVLLEAANVAESQMQFERTTGPRVAAQVSENVGILRVSAELRRLAGEAQQDEAWDLPDARPGTTDHTLTQRHEAQQDPAPGGTTPCGPAPSQCDAEAGEPCANHEREQAHAEGEHCFCGPECAAVARSGQPETDSNDDDPPVQCWHTEPDTPCDWDVCRQPERLAAGDCGTDPANEAR